MVFFLTRMNWCGCTSTYHNLISLEAVSDEAQPHLNTTWALVLGGGVPIVASHK